MKNRYFMMPSIDIDKRICYLFIGLLLGIAAWGIDQTVPVQPTAHAQADFSCTNVSEIPQGECEALVAIHNANQVDWIDWLTTNTPCSWEYLVCDNGHIIELDLREKGLNSLPVEIGNLTSLTKLNLYGNRLVSLPTEIGNLSLLNGFHVGNNQLLNLPSEIGNLSSIEWINLEGNALASLPPEIGNLSSLRWLNVSKNELTSLPSEIGSLSSLNILYAHNNRLASLPPEIGNLSALTGLGLSSNQLTSLPSEIGNLSSLDVIEAQNNQLTSLPPEIGNLSSSLDWLDVRNNQLTSLPAEIGNLAELDTIRTDDNPSMIQPVQFVTSSSPSESSGTVERSMSGPYYARGSSVQLTAVPATNWQFDSWEGPDGVIAEPAISITIGESEQTYTANFIEQTENGFNCANVSEIPQGECKALVALSNVNPVEWGDWLTTDTPCNWSGITCRNGHVTDLYLSNRGLTNLPAEISALSFLSDLIVDQNLLTSLPPEIGNLTSLTALGVSYNQLTSLPPEIGNLTALTALGVTNNQLTSLPPEIGNLTSLDVLSASSNPLPNLPSEIGNLTALTVVGLGANQLTSLPPEIGNLTALTYLDVNNNQLTSLPSEIGYMTALQTVDTANNPSIIQPVQLVTSSSPFEASGTVERSMPGPYYARGSSVQLTAVPAAGWQFDYWEGPQISDAQSTQETITINAGQSNESYTAYFVEEPVPDPGAVEVLGDVSCMNGLDAVDAMLILQYVVGQIEDSGRCPLAGANMLNAAVGDVNGNGSVDAGDALVVLQCVVGTPNALCPAINAATSMKTDDALLIEEVKQMLRGEGLWAEQTVDLLLPIVVK